MPDRHLSKAQLRQEMRRRRQALGPLSQQAAAEAASDQITRLATWPGARRVALYLANDGEVDTSQTTSGALVNEPINVTPEKEKTKV